MTLGWLIVCMIDWTKKYYFKFSNQLYKMAMTTISI